MRKKKGNLLSEPGVAKGCGAESCGHCSSYFHLHLERDVHI